MLGFTDMRALMSKDCGAFGDDKTQLRPNSRSHQVKWGSMMLAASVLIPVPPRNGLTASPPTAQLVGQQVRQGGPVGEGGIERHPVPPGPDEDDSGRRTNAALFSRPLATRSAREDARQPPASPPGSKSRSLGCCPPGRPDVLVTSLGPRPYLSVPRYREYIAIHHVGLL